jgi:hypothetical protein
MASTYLTTTFGTATNQRIGTFSFWIKISKLGSSGDKYIFSTYENDNNRTICKLNGNDKFEFQAISGSNVDLRFDTNRVFRDTNAWYHIVITTDTTLSTAADRVKIYVNGVQETSFSTSTIPTQNIQPHYLYNSLPKVIGAYANGNVNNFDGLMSHIHFTDGTAYDASAFGEYDANGVWKIKTSPSVTYGNNGFFILKDGNSVTDQSGNGNNFTVGGGTLTNTEDNPSNVFATLSPLHKTPTGQTLSNGNLTATNSAVSLRYNNCSTICSSSGKYYAEVKIDTIGGETGSTIIGFLNADKAVTFQTATDFYNGQDNFSAGWYSDSGAVFYQTASTWQTLSSFTTGDILQFAMDLDNGFFYFGKNGTWQNSADPTSGATGTGGLAVSGLGSSGDTFGFSSTVRNNGIYSWNFGNGYFGTTAVASAGTNASGIGIFEYDVPTGYTALSTKGLNL